MTDEERQPVEDVLSGFTLHPVDEGWLPILSGQSVGMRLCRRFHLATGNRPVARRRSRTQSSGYNNSVRRAVRWTIGAVVLMVALTACGVGDGGGSETQVPSETSSMVTSTTTSTTQAKSSGPETTAAGANCAELAAKAIRLAQDVRGTMRGIRPPTPEEEAKLRERELALRDEARLLGCPVPRQLFSDVVREDSP